MSPDGVHIQPAPTGGWIRRLMPFITVHRRDIWIALAASLVGQGLSGLVPLVQRAIVDDVITRRSGSIIPWVAALLGIALVTFGLSFVRRWFGGRVSLAVQHDLRTSIFDRLMRLDFAGHDQLRTGQLVSRASADLGLIQQLMAFLPIMLGNLVLLAVALIVMLKLSPLLTLVMVVALPLMAVVALQLRTTVFPASWEAQQRAGEVAGVVDEAVTGVRIVKGFGAEQREIDKLGQAATSLYRSRVRLVRLTARATSTLSAIPSFAQVVVLAGGGWLALQHRVSLGTLLAFSSYLVQLVAPVRMMALVIAAFQQARAGAARVLDILDANAAIVDAPDAVELTGVRGELEFRDVRFGYTTTDPVLNGFTLHVEPGEVVALVGGSGSGKSTVTALLPRFYDVSSGVISIDKTPITTVTLESLRSQVGVVFEEAFLFSDTVSANISYGRPNASHDSIRVAARAAGAEQFIDALPDGFDTVVGERGLTLSGGQRQRIALARAIVSNPRVLILDDATSAVDTATEESIHAALRSVMTGRTTLLVAHRASTVRLADRVLVLDEGKVVDEGTHDELLRRSWRYRALLGEGLDVGPADAARTGDPVTPAAWPALDTTVKGPSAPSTHSDTPGRPGPGNFGANLAATPQLLAALDRLPPANDDPEVDLAAAAAEPPDRFQLLRFLRPWRNGLLIGLGLIALDAMLTVLGPALIRNGLGSGVQANNRGVLWATAVVFAVVTTLDWSVTWAGTLVTGRTAERSLLALRIRIFAHLQRLSLDFYDHELDGRIMTRMTSDVDALTQLVQSGLVSAIVGVGTCVGVSIFLLWTSPLLALAAASVLPMLAGTTWWYQRQSSVAYRDARDAIASVNANLQENLSGVRVAQAYGRQKRNSEGFREVSGNYLGSRLRAQRLLSLYFPAVALLSDLSNVVVLAAGAALVTNGRTTTTVVVAFVLYLNVFFAPIQQLSQVFDTWQQASAATAKITELLTTASATPAPAVPVSIGRLRGAISLHDVHHRYVGTSVEALTGVQIDIAAGESVAIVGETGAGKSTVVKLIARFHDPTSGSVTVDGIDLRDIDLNAYRHQLGVVPQEPFLFTGTVRDNIAYGRPDADDLAVETAARAVGAHRFIALLPHGYRTEVSERGRSLSAGQRQLIALARAQLVDPVILLLDEATANLDLTAEAAVRAAMSAVTANRTTVLVAHRLPTARSADRIVVMREGAVVEQGTHDKLLSLEGHYASLWSAHIGR